MDAAFSFVLSWNLVGERENRSHYVTETVSCLGFADVIFRRRQATAEIRLHSQAKCRATNSQTNSQPQNTQLNLLTVTFLAILKVNRDKLALINRQWKCKKGKRLVITANFEEQNLGAVYNLGPRWENPDRWSARLANQIQRFRIPDR